MAGVAAFWRSTLQKRNYKTRFYSIMHLTINLFPIQSGSFFGEAYSVLWGSRGTVEKMATADEIRRLLTKTLYYHLHPRKTKTAIDASGQVCTDKELAAFIWGKQRKVAQLRLQTKLALGRYVCC